MTDDEKDGKRPIQLIIIGSVVVSLLLGFVLGSYADLIEDGEDGNQFEEPYSPSIDPDDFTNIVDNEYFPLAPGTTWTYRSVTDGPVEEIVVTVLDDVKMVMGISCVVVRDTVTVDGEVVEDTYDWYAQDSAGNVWYMGEDSKTYENGQVVSTEGSWEAGIDGAYPGIVMLADPMVGISYRQEYYKGFAEDMALVVSLNGSESVEHGDYDDLLMTSEWTPLDSSVLEHKFYAKGIGLVLEVSIKGGSERIELIEVVHRT